MASISKDKPFRRVGVEAFGDVFEAVGALYRAELYNFREEYHEPSGLYRSNGREALLTLERLEATDVEAVLALTVREEDPLARTLDPGRVCPRAGPLPQRSGILGGQDLQAGALA